MALDDHGSTGYRKSGSGLRLIVLTGIAVSQEVRQRQIALQGGGAKIAISI
jgi:hypothetical protein